MTTGRIRLLLRQVKVEINVRGDADRPINAMQEKTMSSHAVARKHSHQKEFVEKGSDSISSTTKAALSKAMKLEHVLPAQDDDLLWIMAQESSGQVNARNPHSTAGGLFQLLRNNYDLNPNGIKSFGDDVEECQGGIRYIVQRYHSARAARQFWEKHHWY